MFPMRDVESCEGRKPRAIAFERHESGILRDKSFDSIGDYTYGPNSSTVWASYTQGKGGTFCVMQNDGNLVIYNASGAAIWHTHTGGNPDAVLSLQPSGRLTITQARPVWARFGYTPSILARKVYYPNNADPMTNSTKPYPTQIGTIGYEF